MSQSLFKAIADPNRRQMIELVSKDDCLNLNNLAGHFKMSRQAVSKHLKILEKAELITIEQNGRERVYLPNLQKLKEVEIWVSKYSQFWNNALYSLEKHLENKN